MVSAEVNIAAAATRTDIEKKQQPGNDSIGRPSTFICMELIGFFWPSEYCCSFFAASSLRFADFYFYFNFQFKSFPIKFHRRNESEKHMKNTVDTWLDSEKLASIRVVFFSGVFSSLFLCVCVFARFLFGIRPKTLVLIGLEIK